MRILMKIINAVMPVSRRTHNSEMELIVKVLEGLKVANGQQAEMLASIANQVSGLHMIKAEKEEKQKKDMKYDEAFQ